MKTMNRIGKGVIGAVVSLALVFGMIPGMSMTSYAATWDSDQLIDADTTIDGGVTVSKSITLTINEGVTLTVNGGISAKSKTLTVEGGGTLVVNGVNGNDGSSSDPNGGSGVNAITGTLRVNNATVTITGGRGGDGANASSSKNAGYGGMGGNAITGDLYVSNGSTVTLNGGRGGDGGNANGRNAARGGNGGYGVNGIVTVNNGSVTIIGGSGGTGGTGGYNLNAGNGGRGGTGISSVTTTILDGSVTMIGGSGGNGGAKGSGTSQAGSVGEAGISVRQDSNMTLGAGVTLYEGTDNTGTVLDGNTESQRSYTVEKKTSMYAEKSAHTHTWDYAVGTGDDANTITATCTGEGDCEYKTNGITLTINKPDRTTTAGTESAEATITGYPTSDVPSGLADAPTTITYQTKTGDTWGAGTTIAPTTAGTHRASFTWGGQTASIEYTILGTITASAQGYNGAYDGKEHGITVTATDYVTGEEISDATIMYGTDGESYDQPASPTVTDVTDEAFTVYYQVSATGYETVTGSADIVINPIGTVVCSADNVEVDYDGQPHSIDVQVTTPTSGSTIEYRTDSTEEWTSTNPTVTDVTDEAVTVYYRVSAPGYTAATGSATVTINNATMTVEAPDYSAPYDGVAHGITVTVINPSEGATVLYGESADACTETTSPTYSYGEHTVYFVVSADNYNDYTGSATVVISDIDVVATIEAYNGPYDGDAHGITITVTDPSEGATVMYGTEEGSYDYEVSPVFTEIGDYTVFYMITAEGHNPLEGSATVSIGELTIDATVTPYDGVFDGAEHGVTVTVNTPEVGATVLFGTEEGVYDLDESPTYCEIGTYTVYYQISAEYYAPLEGSVVVRISENPDRDNARDTLIALISASDEILGEWGDLIPEDLVEALMEAEDAAYDVLNNEIASIEQLEAAADNLANALGNILQYIAENYETEPELTPEQRTRLCVINFVENLYLHALGRPFDVSGRDSWVSLIMDQGGTGTQVARGFLGSQEFLGLGLDNEGFVKALYNALFNRAPEAEEVDTWTNALAAGVTREEVINAFFASPEWARTCAYYRVNI